MRIVRRIGLVAGAAVLVGVAFVAWSTYGAWPVPEGYEFPRHSMWGGPDALFEGTLVDEDGCILTDGGDAVVWPPFYSLAIVDGEPVVRGGGREVRMGQAVAMGGGWYTGDQLGDVAVGAVDTRCGDSLFLTTGWTD